MQLGDGSDMQELSLQKKKTFENFILDKLSKKSKSYHDKTIATLRRLDDYSAIHHKNSRDDIIEYLRNIQDLEKREDECIAWVQGFVDNLHKYDKLSFRVLQVYISHVKKYLKYYKIRIDFGEEIEMPPNLMEERYAIPIENIQAIIENAPWKFKGYFLSLVSSGARPIEIMALCKKDFVWTGKFWRALIPAKYTKKKISRTVFFSIEVTPYLGKLLREREDNDRVWTFDRNAPDEKLIYSRLNAGKRFREICYKLGFTERYETTNFLKHNMYCFRAYFFTKALSSLAGDNDTAHAMIGHGAYLAQYQRRNNEEKQELFEEVQPAILVYDQTKNKEKIRQLKEANEKIQESKEEVLDLKDELSDLKKELRDTKAVNLDQIIEDKLLKLLDERKKK